MTVAAGFVTISIVLSFDPPAANWRGGILFDNAVQGGVGLRSQEWRKHAILTSDLLYYGLAAYPILVDSLLVAGAIHGASDVMAQTLLINAESYALAGLVATVAENSGRVRPLQDQCDKDPAFDVKCKERGANNYGFLSGHTAAAWTGAGLLCAHHQNIPLYGGGAGDVAACVAGVVGATASGVLRVVTDNHYTSDILLGSALGFAAGYILPTQLHYKSKKKDGTATTRGLLPSFQMKHGARTVAAGVLAPDVSTTRAGLAFSGVF
jgi:membrane-associated phospholipid phosphatase